jgi:hypothetical protein
MAPWNLHERVLTLRNDKYFVNNEYPLVFYHFSEYDPNKSDSLSKGYTRVNFHDNVVLKKVYDKYGQEVLNNNYNKLSKIKCYYSKNIFSFFSRKAEKFLKKIVRTSQINIIY